MSQVVICRILKTEISVPFENVPPRICGGQNVVL